MKSLLLIIITTALVNNVVLSQFLGICSFLGVSRYIKTSFSLGAAVIFVITVASAVANPRRPPRPFTRRWESICR